MTIPAKSSRKVISGSGWSNPLQFDIYIESSSHIEVWADDVLLALGTNYTVSGVADPAGFSVTILSPSSYAAVEKWVLLHTPPMTQGADLSVGGAFGLTFENSEDAIMRRVQAVNEKADRAWKRPLTSDGTEGDAGQLLIIDELGTVVPGPAADDISSAQEYAAAALAAQIAAEAAAAAAEAAAAAIEQKDFATKALAEAFAPTVAPDFIRLAGYSAAGDYGGALYKKVVSEPSHDGKFSITLDDAVTVVWFEISEPIIRPEMVGTWTGTDDQTIVQTAVNVAKATGSKCVTFLPGRTYTVDGIDMDDAIFLDNPGFYGLMVDEGTSTLPLNSASKLLFRAAATPRSIVKWQGPDADDVIVGGGFRGLIFDGNNVATVGVQMVSMSYQFGEGIIQRCTTWGLALTDANGPINAHGWFPNIIVLLGSDAAVQSCTAFALTGSYPTNGGVTSHTFGNALCEYHTADPVKFDGNDSITFMKLKCVERAGFAAGARVRFIDDGGFASHKNAILHGVRVKAYAEDLTSNYLGFLGSEGASAATEGTGVLHYLVNDYLTGEHYVTPAYPMQKELNLFGSNLIRAHTGTPAIAGFAGAAVPVWAFDGAATETIAITYHDEDISSGNIVGYRVRHMRASGTGAADVKLQLDLWTRSGSGAVGTVEKTETTVAAVNTAAVTVTETTVTFGTALAIARADTIYAHFTRFGGDALDTLNAVDLGVIDLTLLFESDGPTAGSWEPTPRIHA